MGGRFILSRCLNYVDAEVTLKDRILSITTLFPNCLGRSVRRYRLLHEQYDDRRVVSRAKFLKEGVAFKDGWRSPLTD